MGYEFKSKPFAHQLKLFNETKDMPSFALLWEQGTGKTKPVIDTAAYLYEKGEIDAVLVLAPNGVHRNWRSDELPVHLPDRLHKKVKVHTWDTQKANNVGVKKDREAILKHDGMAWLLVSYDGFMTKTAKNFIWRFLKQRRVLYVADEGHNIKTPSAKRTISIVASSKYARYRRLLTGTPIAQGPFDIYSQLKFLDENYWRQRRLGSYKVFKFFFGEWFTAADCEKLHGYDPGYDKLLEYKNLDKLAAMVADTSSRVLKEDVLDLPPKLYSRRYFTLNKEQTRVYEALKKDFEAELVSGKRVDGALAITRLLRLQQVVSGYAQGDDPEEPVELLGPTNPLLETTLEELEGRSQPGIIWCRFKKDIDLLMDALGSKATRYDGTLTDDEAERSKLAFQRGEFQWFVGNAQKGGSGLTLIQAKSVHYYSNSFKLIDRLQSEDRAHRIGQEHPVDYIDYEGRLPGDLSTVARHIIDALKFKLDIASQITGDKLKEWI